MVFRLPWRNSYFQTRLLHHVWAKNRNFSASSSQQSYMEHTQKLYEAIKDCSSIGSVSAARKLHCQLIFSGLDSSIFLQNHLLHMYYSLELVDDACKIFDYSQHRNIFSFNTMISGLLDCGRVSAAQKLFEKMPDRDSVSWTAMMSGYFHNGLVDDCIRIFVSMVKDFNCLPDQFSFSCVMKACGSLGYKKMAIQLHSFLEKFSFRSELPIQNSIIDMYIKCGAVCAAEKIFSRIEKPSMFCWNSMIYGYSKCYGVEGAFDTFMQMPERDSVSWNTIISIFSQHGFGKRSLRLFIEMLIQGCKPNSMTYASVLSACSSINDLEWGKHLHARIVRTEQSLDLVMSNGLVDMYVKCGLLEASRKVFNSMPEKNVVSWTCLISGLALAGHEEEALVLFNRMRLGSVQADEFILATVLKACSGEDNTSMGENLHGYTIKTGTDSSVPVGNATITMYANCGNVEKAQNVFASMQERDIISWTALISAFCRSAEVGKARDCFDKMPERNVITWNSIISTYIQHGHWEEGLKLYLLMQRESFKPDCITFATVISACADLAVVNLGIQIISQAEKSGFNFDVSVLNSEITMYARCGRIEEAEKVFHLMSEKNLISWNSLMAGYAQNGQGLKVIELFENMLEEGLLPNDISFVSVLSGCSHSGLVKEGKYYFESMKDFNLSPTSEQFACMVDLLGRAGLLEEARHLINCMPFKPNAAIWGAFLSACRIHHTSELAEFAVKNLIELGSGETGNYVLLANIYSESGRLEGASSVRKVMREREIHKDPGCSWIEVNNRVHVFTVNDTNHPEMNQIYSELKEITRKIEDSGCYVDDPCSVHSSSYHSERLAVAFGLMSIPAWMPIRVMKNLRVCIDCHRVLKMISLVASRKLIVRDGHRFHHFKDGICSCGDYW